MPDTPSLPVGENNRGKPLYPKISKLENGTTNAEDGGDIFMNYMDYCDDDATIMFTKGQINVMRNTLTLFRQALFGTNFGEQLMDARTPLPPSESHELAQFKLVDWYQSGRKSLAAIMPSRDALGTMRLRVVKDFADPIVEDVEIGQMQTKIPGSSAGDYAYAFARWPYEDGARTSSIDVEKQKTNALRPSVLAIRRSGDSSAFVIMEVWAAQYDYGEILQTCTTVLPVSDHSDDWAFLVADWNLHQPLSDAQDLIAIRKSNTVNGKVEIHVLSGIPTGMKLLRYQQWLAHRYTALDEIAGPAQFSWAGWNGDGTRDLVAIYKNADESAWLADILAGAADHRDFLLRVEVSGQAPSTKEEYDFAMADTTGDGRPDLVAVQKTTVGDNARVIVLVG